MSRLRVRPENHLNPGPGLFNALNVVRALRISAGGDIFCFSGRILSESMGSNLIRRLPHGVDNRSCVLSR